MKYGIYSDIHSNLEALNAVFDSMSKKGVKRKICLGDAVGYGPYPNECIRRIQQESYLSILGNHDSVALGREASSQFNFFARNAIEWTAKELAEDTRKAMDSWPYIKEDPPFTFVHASPRSPAEWTYIATLDEAVDAFAFFRQRICFIGHTHMPIIVVMESDQEFFICDRPSFRLQSNQRALVNVGSVGQPRDGQPQACWCLCDSKSFEIEIIRVEYSVQKTQQAMREKGLDEFLINRLSIGK